MEKEKKIKLVKIIAIIIGIIYAGIIIKHYYFIGGKEFYITFEFDTYSKIEIEDKDLVRYVKSSIGGTFNHYYFRALKPGETNIYFGNNKEVVYKVVIDENLEVETTDLSKYASNYYKTHKTTSPYDLTKEILEKDRLFYITPEVDIDNIKEVRITDESLVEYLGIDEKNNRFIFKASVQKGKSTIYLDYKEPTASYVVREQYQIEIMDDNIIDKVPVIDYRDVEYPSDRLAVYIEDSGIMIILADNAKNVTFNPIPEDESIVKVVSNEYTHLAEDRMRYQFYLEAVKEGETKINVAVYNNNTKEIETEVIRVVVDKDLKIKYNKENHISNELY